MICRSYAVCVCVIIMCTLPGNMALSRCMGLLLHYYQIVSKEQKLNDYCFFDELLDCIEFLTVFHECSRLLKSVINHNTEGLAVDR